MKISKKSEYAIKAVITIAKHANYKPLKISEISTFRETRDCNFYAS